MNVDIPIKKEKFSERITFYVEPSTKEMLSAAETAKGLDVPQFMRNLLKSALDEIQKPLKKSSEGSGWEPDSARVTA
jgi:uncharacterized protein (DUF1778 family)